jgi:hypothetical protein
VGEAGEGPRITEREGPPERAAQEVPEEKTLEQIGKSLRECGMFAEENGVKIPAGGARDRDLTRAADPQDSRLRRQSPGVRICWNSNQTDLLDGGFEANFKLLKDQIGQIHMRDLYLEEYPFRALISNLAAMNFQGYCFAEIPESTDAVRVLRYFQGAVPGVSESVKGPSSSASGCSGTVLLATPRQHLQPALVCGPAEMKP